MAADLTRDAAMLVATLPAGPMNVPDVDLEPWDSPTVLKTHLVKPTAGTLALTLVHVPPRLHANQPLEVEFAVRLGQSVAAIERSYFPHVAVLVDVKERRHSVPVSVRLADGSWVARALLHPASWTESARTSPPKSEAERAQCRWIQRMEFSADVRLEVWREGSRPPGECGTAPGAPRVATRDSGYSGLRLACCC